MRNRIAHAGHHPDLTAAQNAFDALVGLEGFVGDRLTATGFLSKWPRTAIKWRGIEQMKLRGQWTPALEQLVSSPDEPSWMDTFQRWKGHFHRLRGYIAIVPGSQLDKLDLFAELHPDGSEKWLLHDRASGMAALVDGSTVAPPKSVASVAALHATLKTQAIPHPTRILVSVDWKANPPPATAAWVPDYSVMEDMHIDLPQHRKKIGGP